MAGGWIDHLPPYPVTAARLFENVHNSGDVGLGVEASLGADAIWRLRFPMPPALPTGTATLRLIGQANATSGVARVNPKWASVAVGADPQAASLNAEGTTPDSRAGAAGSPGAGDTLVWGTGDANQYLEARWTMNAGTVPAADEIVAVDLTFETASWTLAQISTWKLQIGWV